MLVLLQNVGFPVDSREELSYEELLMALDEFLGVSCVLLSIMEKNRR